MTEKKEKRLHIKYPELREWLACPNCQNRDAKIEEGSLQLYCPNCNRRENLVDLDNADADI